MGQRKSKILVVDDDYSSRRLIEKILRSNFNFQIVQAEDGSEALRTMLKEQPDLVILDMLMPFMNGVQVLKTMKKSNELNQIPVIACTGVGDDKIVKQVINYGVLGYIMKPIKQKALVEKVAEIVKSTGAKQVKNGK